MRKAESIFNLEEIQLAAAMKNPALTLGEYARLQLKKDILALEQAIQDQDVAGATALAKKVNIDIERLNKLRDTQLSLIKISDLTDELPENIELIDLMNLANALALIKKLQADLDLLTKTEPKVSAGNNGGATAAELSQSIAEGNFTLLASQGAGASGGFSPIVAKAMAAEANAKSMSGSSMSAPSGAAYAERLSYGNATGTSVVINVAGSVTAEQDLVNAVLSGIQEQSASGTRTTVNRLDPAYL